jgi:hypothetical protein
MGDGSDELRDFQRLVLDRQQAFEQIELQPRHPRHIGQRFFDQARLGRTIHGGNQQSGAQRTVPIAESRTQGRAGNLFGAATPRAMTVVMVMVMVMLVAVFVLVPIRGRWRVMRLAMAMAAA